MKIVAHITSFLVIGQQMDGHGILIGNNGGFDCCKEL